MNHKPLQNPWRQPHRSHTPKRGNRWLQSWYLTCLNDISWIGMLAGCSSLTLPKWYLATLICNKSYCNKRLNSITDGKESLFASFSGLHKTLICGTYCYWGLLQKSQSTCTDNNFVAIQWFYRKNYVKFLIFLDWAKSSRGRKQVCRSFTVLLYI